MKFTKRLITRACCFIIIMAMILSLSSSLIVTAIDTIEDLIADAVAIPGKQELLALEEVTTDIFGEREINACGYLYNLDDSADYIYVAFTTGGYAIFAKQTMEMLEYNLAGTLPYDTTAQKYYVGPNNYLQKSNNTFYHALTGTELQITVAEMQAVAQQTRAAITNTAATKYNVPVNESEFSTDQSTDANTRSSTPGYDTAADSINAEDLLEDLLNGDTAGKCIANYRYFLAEPLIGENNSITCGSVAAQLLLSYNNYCVNRSIIPMKYLIGTDENGNIIENRKHQNPNTCTDPVFMSEYTTGTKHSDTGADSFYAEMINRIIGTSTNGSSIDDVCDGINSYLSSQIELKGTYNLHCEERERHLLWGYLPIQSSKIKSEIDAGRPLIIGMDDNLGSIDHWVVGYGYVSYSYPDGSGTYDGYIVHGGWTLDTQTSQKFYCIWINSAWCDSYISLKFNHVHNYDNMGSIEIPNETEPEGTQRIIDRIEYKCSTCGHRTDSAIHIDAGSRYHEHFVAFTQQNRTHDFYLTFDLIGAKLIQTFGNQDTQLALYDSEYNLIASNENGGYNNNALIHAYLQPNTAYILRVSVILPDAELYPNAETHFKVTFIPTFADLNEGATTIQNYEDIYAKNALRYTYETYVQSEYVKILTYAPPAFLVVDFTLESNVDTFIYVIDPSSSEPIQSGFDYDDNSADGLNPFLYKPLDKDIPYLVIYSTADILANYTVVEVTLRIKPH